MSTSPIRLLLVEDNAGRRAAAEAYAGRSRRGSRSHVTHAESMAEAVGCLAGESFDAILLDLSLPDSSGVETVAQANAAAPHLPIVVMTGLDDEATAMEAVRQGGPGFSDQGARRRPASGPGDPLRHGAQAGRAATQGAQRDAGTAGGRADRHGHPPRRPVAGAGRGADADRAPRAPPPGADSSRSLAAAPLRGPAEPGRPAAATSRRSRRCRRRSTGSTPC